MSAGTVAAAPLDHRAERLALEQLHHHEDRVALLQDVVDIDHVRVADARRCLRLACEALDRIGIGRELRVHPLERHALEGQRVLGLEDRAHTAFAEQPHDAVLAADDRAG